EISADKSFQFPDHEPIDGETPEIFDVVEKIPDGTIVAYFEDTVNEFHNRMPESVIKALDQPAESSEKMGAQKSKGKYLIPLDIYKRHRGIIDKHADDVFLHQNTHNRKMPISFQMTDWLEFIGYYVAEGEINEAQNSITIHQNDRINPEAIYELLDQMEVNYNNDGDAIHISNQFLGNWLEENCGSEHNDKRLPEMVFDLDGDEDSPCDTDSR
ncbi:MAG: DNA polymerase, partial [Halobacteriaceae archaeon]